MALFDVGTGLFMGGVVDQSNRNRQLSVQESLAELEKTKLGISIKNTQQEQATEFINELVGIATEIKKNFPGTSEEFMESKAAGSVDALLSKADELAAQTGLPTVDYRMKVASVPTPMDKATLEAQQDVAQTERKIEASGGDRQKEEALGVGRPEPQFVNFKAPDSDKVFAIDITDPNAVAALPPGAQKITSFGVEAPDVGGLGVTTKQKNDFVDAERAAAVAVAEAENAKQQLGDDPLTGWSGGIVRGLSSLAGNLQQIAGLMGATAEVGGEVTTEARLLNAANYTFDAFGEKAAKSQALKSNMLALAYALARGADPGGRLSDRDVQVQLDALAAGSGDKGQMEASLDEAIRRTKTAYGIMREQAEARGAQLPPPPSVLRSAPRAEVGLPEGIPPGSKFFGTTADGRNPIYETPDGRRLVVE